MALLSFANRAINRFRLERRRRDPYVQMVAALPSEWYGPGSTSDAEMVFIGGCPRSGTTLLREMLGRHRHLATGLEAGFFHRRPEIDRLAFQWDMPEHEVAAILRASPSLADFVEAMAEVRIARSSKRRYVEKTPINCRFVSQILDLFPRGRFIHIIRDGRDAVCSIRNFGGSEFRNGKMVKITPVPTDIAHSAQFWVNEVSLGMATRDHPRCLEVRYEQLIADPEAELARVCAFIGEEFDPAMLVPQAGGKVAGLLWSPNADEALDKTRVGRWRTDLGGRDRCAVAHVAGGLLIALGYVSDNCWVQD
jgi:protein-tyrosine sulfotransferase